MPDFQRYFTAAHYRRFMLSLLLLIAGGTGFCYRTLADELQQLAAEKWQNEQKQQTAMNLNQQLSALPANQTAAAEPLLPLFSVTDMLRRSGGRLKHWRPDKTVSQLELSLTWEKAPCVFRHLAGYKDADLETFKMKADPSVGRVSLTLEFRYATH